MTRQRTLSHWLADHLGSLDRRLFWLRWATIALVLAASLTDHGSARLGLPPAFLAASFGVYNAAVEGARLRRHAGYGPIALADLAVETALLWLCASPTCPLYALFWLSAMVAALSFSVGGGLVFAALAPLSYLAASLGSADVTPIAASASESLPRSLALLVFGLAAVAIVRQWRLQRQRASAAKAAAHRLSVLNGLVRTATAALELDEVAMTVAQLTRQALGAASAAICIVDPAQPAAGRVWSTSQAGWRLVRLRQLGLPPDLFTRRQPAPVEPTAARRTLLGEPGDGSPCSIVLAPLLLEDEPLGVLAAGRQDRRFATGEASLLQAIADHVAPAIRNARLLVAERQQVRRWQAPEEARDDLLSWAAHELRTPLTTLKLVSGLLANRLEGVGEHDRDLLESLGRNTARLEQMTELVVDAARLQDGALQLRSARVDLRRLVLDIVGHGQRGGLTGERPVQATLTAQSVLIIGDRRRLKLALESLLDAADAATPPGTPLAVALRATGSTVVLDISPLGAEAAPAPPAAASATPPATGAPLQPGTNKLPVEVARLLVERHGGRLEQSDAAGRRGSFRLSLPLAVLNEEPDTCAS